MESDIKISPEQFCRTCLCKSTNMRSLTSKMEGEHRTLLEALVFIVNLDIKTSEKVPTQLCNECEIVLLKADEFKRRCVESETILETHMKNDNFVHFDVSVCNKPELKDEPPVRKVKTSKNVSKKRSTKSEKPNKPAIFDLFASSSCKGVKNEKEDAANLTADCFDNKFSDLLDIKPDIEMPVKSETGNQNSDSGDSLDAPIDFGESDDFDTPLIALKQENSFLDELKMYSCISCGVVCNTEKEYKDHLQEKKCNANENGFTKTMKIKILKKHSNGSRNITIKRQILCPECGEEFKSVKACRLHRRTHKNDDNDKGVYKCNKCMRKFSRKSSYTTHMNHHDLKANVKYTCDTCKREFQHRAHLDNHILSVHTAQKGYTCEVCSTNFSTQESLDTHKESHKMEKKHICHLCNKSFYMLSTLNDHMRTHTGEKPFLCSICGKGFSQKTNLTQHMWRHQGLKPFKCEECERRFVSKGELVAHTRKHSGAHPFICDDCGSGFTTSSSLVKHRRTHTGERPYACDLCPMRFAASGTLKNHRRTHTGEKPFQCSYCEKAFVQRHDLISHIRCHTGERPYTCGCGLAFRKAASMRHHAKMHARDGMHCPQIPMLGTVPDDQPMKMGHH